MDGMSEGWFEAELLAVMWRTGVRTSDCARMLAQLGSAMGQVIHWFARRPAPRWFVTVSSKAVRPGLIEASGRMSWDMLVWDMHPRSFVAHGFTLAGAPCRLSTI